MGAYATLWRLLARDSGAGKARGALRAWDVWERVSEWVWPIRPIPGTNPGVIRMRIAPYRGPVVRLNDGTTIYSGTPIARLHLNNSVAAAVTTGAPWRLQHMAAHDLQVLAAWIAKNDGPQRPAALYGKTLLGQAARRLGFTSVPCSRTPYLLLFHFYLQGLMVLHSHDGWRRIERGHVRTATCSDIWMSTTELLRRYGPTA